MYQETAKTRTNYRSLLEFDQFIIIVIKVILIKHNITLH